MNPQKVEEPLRRENPANENTGVALNIVLSRTILRTNVVESAAR